MLQNLEIQRRNPASLLVQNGVSHSFSARLSRHVVEMLVACCGPPCSWEAAEEMPLLEPVGLWRAGGLHGQAAPAFVEHVWEKAELGSAGNKGQTGGTQSDVWGSVRGGRDRRDLSGGKANQAEVDACAILQEGVGICVRGGTTQCEGAEWVCTVEAQSMAWVVLICAWEADACRVRSKLLRFPHADI